MECGSWCLRNDRCRSYNCYPAQSFSSTKMCYLNNETRRSKPEDYLENQGVIYFEVINSNFVRENLGRWSRQLNKSISHNPGSNETINQSEKIGSNSSSPGDSCKHIRESRDSLEDGEYWIDPEKNGNPLKVFCDMTTDGGGWLLVANLVTINSTPTEKWTAETSFRWISNFANNKMGITLSAMKELRSHLSFTQLRFHCSKQLGRTFHVTTATNSSGEAVVQYFSGQTDVLPPSCNSFERMNGDNSRLALQCDRWEMTVQTMSESGDILNSKRHLKCTITQLLLLMNITG